MRGHPAALRSMSRCTSNSIPAAPSPQRLERSTVGCPGSKFSEIMSFELLMLLLDGAILSKSEDEFMKCMPNHGNGGVIDYLLAMPDGSTTEQLRLVS